MLNIKSLQNDSNGYKKYSFFFFGKSCKKSEKKSQKEAAKCLILDKKVSKTIKICQKLYAYHKSLQNSKRFKWVKNSQSYLFACLQNLD